MIIYYTGQDSTAAITGSEQISRNLSNILEKAVDEHVEKEFLSTQEETLTSIPEDPETEAELFDELPNDESKCEEPAQLSSATTPTSGTASHSCTTPTNVEQTKPVMKDYMLETSSYKPSGKLAVGNGSAIFDNQLRAKPSSADADGDDNNNNDEKILPNGGIICDLEQVSSNEKDVDENERNLGDRIEEDILPATENLISKEVAPTVENNNISGMCSSEQNKNPLVGDEKYFDNVPRCHVTLTCVNMSIYFMR